MIRCFRKSVMVILFSLALAGCQSQTTFIAHRGASHLAPENTVASANLAWAKEADAVEVDIYLSQDGQIMVIHDKTTKRTAGEDLDVAKTTTSQLRQLDVGSFKDQVYAGEKIPLLEEIIATVPAKRQLFVEIKCGPEVLPPLQQVIESSGKQDQIVIIGFDLETVTTSKRMMPDIPTYWLVGTQKNKETEVWIPHSESLVDQAIENGLDGLNVHWAGVTKPFVQHAHAAKQNLYVWTVDDPIEATRLVKLGVQGITTNRPQWLKSQITTN